MPGSVRECLFHIPGKEVINWGLEDPTGKDDNVFMDVIRQIEEKIRDLREQDF